MLKKYSVLLGIIVSIFLLLIATMVYPGGSLADKNSVGFNWTKNFISNLFAAKALNGAENPSRIWADIGMMFHALSFAIFFIGYSKKIQAKGAGNVIKYFGVGGMICTFLIVTPLHDIMVTISSTMYLVNIFYITVFIFKTKLHWFKFFCIICLLLFYYTLYIYGTGNWGLLAIMQKIALISSIFLILGLEYFTKKEDFEHIKTKRPSK
jgi:hypothetical protein